MALLEWIKETRPREYTVLSSTIVGGFIIVFNFVYIWRILGLEEYFTLLNLVGAAVALAPSLFMKYREYTRTKEVERRFPDFLRDVTQATRSGMTLPQAIKNASSNQYGALTPHVHKMASQIDWGVPFDEVLERFADRVGSDVMQRTVSTIIETHRSGGNVSDILEVVGDAILEIERIKEERKGHVYSQMLTGYTIFFVFLGVMIGLQKFLIPSLILKGQAGIGGLGGGEEGMEELVGVYKTLFQNLIIIQGAFSGLAIGKMAEGSLMGGLKHIIVLVAIGYTAFFVML